MGRKRRYNNKPRKKKSERKRGDAQYHSPRKFLGRRRHLMAFYNKTLESTFAGVGEVRRFNESLRTSLPTSFRINKATSNFSGVIKRILDEQCKTRSELEVFLEQYPNISPKMFDLRQVHWFPRKSVWVMDATRNLLKKCVPLKSLHRQIQRGSEGGLLTRQELVSMLPPLFLDLQPHDKVLDMCAAPGSKTSQLLENLLMGCSDARPKGAPFSQYLKSLGQSRGAIVANEIETKRAFILSHQMKRFNSSNVTVVNHPGQGFPALQGDSGLFPGRFQFDKVLVDVPCSGDGAIRKIPMKWRNWRAFDGVNLHYLQIQLLQRALELVKVGGLVVYSTCSLNPLENEAVVAEIFRRANAMQAGSLQLEDVHSRFAGLTMRKGMTRWQVLIEKSKKEQQLLGKTGDRQEPEAQPLPQPHPHPPVQFDKMTKPDLQRFIYVNGRISEDEFEPVPHDNYFDCYWSFEEYQKAYEDKKPSAKVGPSLFYQSEEHLKQEVQIEKTGRVHPHDQNTGGFYLAVIRKTKDFAQPQQQAKPTPPAKKQTNVLKEKDLMNFNPISEEDWAQLRDEFALSEDFPRHLLVNSSNKDARRINFINQGLYDILSVPANAALRKIYFGVAVFARNSSKSKKLKLKFRLCYSGLPMVFPYLRQKVLPITYDEFVFFLQRKSSMSFETLRESEFLWKKVDPLEQSSYCLVMDTSSQTHTEHGVEFLVLLKMPASVSIMVAREHLDALRAKYGIQMLPEAPAQPEKPAPGPAPDKQDPPKVDKE